MAFTSVLVLLLVTDSLIYHKHGVSGLRNMRIIVPEAARTGSSVTLMCDYDLESATLYTIKWYKDDMEFYRYLPKESPSSIMFDLPHVNIDFSQSNWKQVTLTNIEKGTSGEYKCEVTADAPLFHTDIRSAHLLAVDIPEEKPVLKAEVYKIAIDEKFKANCTAPAAYPSMNISWFVNDKEVQTSKESKSVLVHNFVSRDKAFPDLKIAQSAISIRATLDLFDTGKIRLKCLATMFTLYASSKEIDVLEDTPQLALIMDPINRSTPRAPTELTKTIGALDLVSFFIFLPLIR